MQAVFNTDDTHNLVVCTLCSCYPWSVLGLPPVWYKAPPYRCQGRHRSARRARGIRADAARDDEDPRLGFDRRTPLPRRAACGRPAPKAGAKKSLPIW